MNKRKYPGIKTLYGVGCIALALGIAVITVFWANNSDSVPLTAQPSQCRGAGR